LHDVTEDVDRDSRSGVRHVDVINRAVEGRVGVHVAASLLHFLVDTAAWPGRRAFEEHVLQHVRHARAEPFSLMNAARHAPRLGRNHRRAVIFADDNRQPVVERGQSHPRWNGGNGLI